MTYRKKLIEVALPLDAINAASVRESYIYKGNPSSIHKWWAQRPLAAARAVIFASLVDDPDDTGAPPEFVEACRKLPPGKNTADHDTPRQRLFDFIDKLVQWESTTDEQVLHTARELIRLATGGDNPPPLVDPFAGGGTIPLEAQRLGLELYASDLNPVAVTINKALIEIPPRFADISPVNPRDRTRTAQMGVTWHGSQGLAADVRYYGEWLREKAWERIRHLYPDFNNETVIAWIWARTVRSPNPAVDVHVPLVKSFALSTKKSRKAWIEPQVDVKGRVSFGVREGNGKVPLGTVKRTGGRCIVTGVPIPFDYIRAKGEEGGIGSQLMAIVTKSSTGRNFYAPTEEHEQAALVPVPDDAPETNLPDQALGFRVQRYGIRRHSRLFTPRQLVAITTFIDLLAEVQEQIYADALNMNMPDDGVLLRDGGFGTKAYSEVVALYLAFACDKYLMYGNAFVPWYAKESRPSMLFSRQAISMVWDYTEVNPFSSIGGSFLRSVEIVANALEPLNLVNSAYAYQADAANDEYPKSSVIISTDPPYYDNIGYADLSDFFYVWLRLSLKSILPNIFSTLLTPKASELIAAPFRFNGNTETAKKHFEQGLRAAFSNMRRVTVPDYPLTVYYAFKQSEVVTTEGDDSSGKYVSSTGWETMLEGLIQAGFAVNGTWPIRTERSRRMRDFESNALASLNRACV